MIYYIISIIILRIETFSQRNRLIGILSVRAKSVGQGSGQIPEVVGQTDNHTAELGMVSAGLFCVGTRRYGVPRNENDESIVCMSVLY